MVEPPVPWQERRLNEVDRGLSAGRQEHNGLQRGPADNLGRVLRLAWGLERPWVRVEGAEAAVSTRV